MNRHIFSSIKILALSYLVTAILLFLLSLLYYKLRFGIGTITILVFFVYVLSCLFGGFLSGKHFRKRRALWGMAFGLLYFLILLTVSFASGKEVTDQLANVIGVCAACILSGLLGGILS